MITKGDNGQEYDNFPRLLNEFDRAGQDLIRKNKVLAATLEDWVTDEEHHTLQQAATLAQTTLGPKFLAEHLLLDLDDWVSKAAQRAIDNLSELDKLCPTGVVENETLAGQVKTLLAQCTQTLTTEKTHFNQRDPFDQRILAGLRYNRKWSIGSHVPAKPPKPDLFKELAKTVETPLEEGLVENAPLVQETKALAARCLNLHKVNGSTESQKAKQINTANAKMVGQIYYVLQGVVLGESDRVYLVKAAKDIEKRIKEAARTNGADFKSCDSAGIDTETQIERAEAHCK
jgi:hypothetical protein